MYCHPELPIPDYCTLPAAGIRQLAFIEKSVFSLQMYGLWCLSTDGRCAPRTHRKTVHWLYPQTLHKLYPQTDAMFVSTDRRCTNCIHRHRTNCIHRRTLLQFYPQIGCADCFHWQRVLYFFRAFAAPASTSPSYFPVNSACSSAANGERINKTKLCAWSFVRQ